LKILVITQNYPPDIGAASFRMKSLVDHLLERKHSVTVLTGTPNRYGSFKSEYSNSEMKENITRIPTRKQSCNLFFRGIGFTDFFLKSYFKTKKLSKDADVIVSTSPQLLVAYLGALCKTKTKPFVLDIRDLWPDVILEMDITTEKSSTYKLLKKIEKKCYKKADEIIINSPAFEQHISKYTDKPIHLITNGIDDQLFEDLSNFELKPYGNPFTITYAGNLGLAQQIDIIADVATEFNNKFKFRIIGDGSGKNVFTEKINERKIKNIEMIDPLPRNELIVFYQMTDAFFVHLKDIDMFKKTIPSKIFEYIATGKPVVYGLEGVAKSIMQELQGNNYSFSPSDTNGLKNALNHLYNNLNANQKTNETGKKILKEKYLRSKLSQRFVEIIEGTKC